MIDPLSVSPIVGVTGVKVTCCATAARFVAHEVCVNPIPATFAVRVITLVATQEVNACAPYQVEANIAALSQVATSLTSVPVAVKLATTGPGSVAVKISPTSIVPAIVIVFTCKTASTQPARVIVSATTVLPGVPFTTAIRSTAQSISAVNHVAVRIVPVVNELSKSQSIVYTRADHERLTHAQSVELSSVIVMVSPLAPVQEVEAVTSEPSPALEPVAETVTTLGKLVLSVTASCVLSAPTVTFATV